MQRKGYNVVNKTGYKRNGKKRIEESEKRNRNKFAQKKESRINAHT